MIQRKNTRVRIVLGFLFAPMLPGTLVALVATLLRGTISTADFSAIMWFFGLNAILGYPVTLTCGVPLYLAFRHWHCQRFLGYMVAGGLLGSLDYLVYLTGELSTLQHTPQLISHLWTTAKVFLPLGIISGSVAGASFWLIVRPDSISPAHVNSGTQSL